MTYLPFRGGAGRGRPETEEEAVNCSVRCRRFIRRYAETSTTISPSPLPGIEYEFAVSPGYLDISAIIFMTRSSNIIPACIEANRQAGRIEEFVQGRYEVEGDSDNMAAIV